MKFWLHSKLKQQHSNEPKKSNDATLKKSYILALAEIIKMPQLKKRPFHMAQKP